MTQYNGYVDIPHSSYSVWKSNTLGNGYNVDNAWGNQCWDFCAELWHQYGLTLYTGDGTAAGCWTLMRNTNAQGPFIIVQGKENIKKGDILVWNISAVSGNGHIAIADEDWHEGMVSIRTLGQMPSVHGKKGPVSLDNMTLNTFLGIFRNKNWDSAPPKPKERSKKRFPWAVAWHNWGW